MKSFLEMTDEEKIQSCDNMMNVLTHNDWPEIYLMFTEAMNNFRQEMENAADWEMFLVNRAKYEYIRDNILKLPETIRSIRDDLSNKEEDADV